MSSCATSSIRLPASSHPLLEDPVLSFESLSVLASLLVVAAIAFVLVVGLRGRRLPESRAVGEGRYSEALSQADLSEDADRASLYAAAVAAKHLLDWDRSETLLRRILDDDDDGEAWLELGLVETYRGNPIEALSCFDRAAAIRSDLIESLTLHRAFARLRLGEVDPARELFEEVEVPLETKLRTDIGSGDPFFVEWFLQCSALWRALGQTAKAEWAFAQAKEAVAESRLVRMYEEEA